MLPSRPIPGDYVIEWRTMVGRGSEPVWTIALGGEVRHIFPDERLAMQVVRELARMAHCHAWLVASGIEPVLLTRSVSDSQPLS
jgi:hypothetical protein